MWDSMRLAPVLLVLCLTSSANAQEWQILPGMTSAKLAASGWQIESAAGLSWPDGRQAVVSFWTATFEQGGLTMRCVSYFDEHFQPTGDICSQPVGQEQQQ